MLADIQMTFLIVITPVISSMLTVYSLPA